MPDADIIAGIYLSMIIDLLVSPVIVVELGMYLLEFSYLNPLTR